MSETRFAAGTGSIQVGKDCLVVRAATTGDIPAIKAIAERKNHALGFVHRGSLARSATRDELVVASVGLSVIGFCQFYRRQDGVATIYHVAVDPERRGEGIGRALLAKVGQDAEKRGMQTVRLKCPADFKANGFYAWIGFQLVGVESTVARPMHVWAFTLLN
jgi:N-acetylglutamate synthase-like GNAT family acetyltransferase